MKRNLRGNTLDIRKMGTCYLELALEELLGWMDFGLTDGIIIVGTASGWMLRFREPGFTSARKSEG